MQYQYIYNNKCFKSSKSVIFAGFRYGGFKRYYGSKITKKTPWELKCKPRWELKCKLKWEYKLIKMPDKSWVKSWEKTWEKKWSKEWKKKE